MSGKNNQKSRSPKEKHPKNRRYPKKPLGFLYDIICLLVRPVFRIIYGLRIDRQAIRGIKGPVLVLCNHQSNLDFLALAATVWPLRLNVMTSNWFYHNRFLACLLNRLGAFPKKQFVPDTGAIKAVLNVVAQGGNVALFPEGQVCYSGANSEVDESIGKLIKKLRITTICITLRGNHLTWPKWYRGKGTFHGRVESCAGVLFSAEDLNIMPLAEVTKKTIDALRYDEYAWQQENKVKFRPKKRRTEGLQNVLHRCAACDTEFAMTSRENALYCERCGYGVRVDRYGLFEPAAQEELICKDPSEWYRRQQKRMCEEFLKDPSKGFSCAGRLYMTEPGKHGFAACGEGQITLDTTGLHFAGTNHDEPFSVSTLFEHQTALSHSANPCAIDVPLESGEMAGLAPLDERKMIYMVDLYALMRKQWLNERG